MQNTFNEFCTKINDLINQFYVIFLCKLEMLTIKQHSSLRTLVSKTSSCCFCQVASVVSDSVRPHRQQPTGLHYPWDSPGKNTGVGYHFLLQCKQVKSETEVPQSVVSDSSWPNGLQPTRLLRPWDFPGKSARVGCHCLLRNVFLVLNKYLVLSIFNLWSFCKIYFFT